MLGDVLIDASLLKNSNVQRRAIDENINDIIITINAELRLARTNGEIFIIVEIPIIFQIPNMTNKEAQRIIWSSIIELLKKKNYNVLINSDNNCCRLKITIIDKEDTEKIKYQMNILAANKGQF